MCQQQTNPHSHLHGFTLILSKYHSPKVWEDSTLFALETVTCKYKWLAEKRSLLKYIYMYMHNNFLTLKSQILISESWAEAMIFSFSLFHCTREAPAKVQQCEYRLQQSYVFLTKLNIHVARS
jgi:hypothetical protein